MGHTTLRRLGGLAALAWSADAAAQTTRIDFQLDAAQAEQLGMDVAALEAELTTLVNDNLKLDEIDTFLDSMANAGAISTKGMGVDYASNPERFVFGGSVGSGVHDAGFRFGKGDETLPTGGFAAQVSLMAGVNLGGITGAEKKSFGRRFLVYVNGLMMPMPSGSPFGGSMYNLGAHLQIRLANPVGAKITEWGGLALTGGFERSQYELSLREELPLTVPVDQAELTWTAAGAFGVTATTDAIPIELSTNVRVFVVTAFLGGGVDLNTGSSLAQAGLGGPIEASGGGERFDLGTADVTVTADGLADELVPRVFVGAQANMTMVKAYGQINVGLNESLGGHVGLRLAI